MNLFLNFHSYQIPKLHYHKGCRRKCLILSRSHLLRLPSDRFEFSESEKLRRPYGGRTASAEIGLEAVHSAAAARWLQGDRRNRIGSCPFWMLLLLLKLICYIQQGKTWCVTMETPVGHLKKRQDTAWPIILMFSICHKITINHISC